MNQQYQDTLKRIVTDKKVLAIPCTTATYEEEEAVYKDLLRCARILDKNPKKRCSGLAANQIGYSCRVIVVKNTRGMFQPYINPCIVSTGAKVTSVESCFSFPGKTFTMQRAKSIYITADYIEGTRLLRGHEAICFQHELDHLNGVLV